MEIDGILFERMWNGHLRGTLVKVALASVGRGPLLQAPSHGDIRSGAIAGGIRAGAFCRDLISSVPQTLLPSLCIRPTPTGMGEERTESIFIFALKPMCGDLGLRQ